MSSRLPVRCLVASLALVCGASAAQAQIPHDASPTESTGTSATTSGSSSPLAPGQSFDGGPPIPPQWELSGPRLGATFSPDGQARSQFGWHFEKQIEASHRGPWLVVETVLLAGGMEQRRLVPSGTLVFGVRLPNGFEFGLGPNVSINPRPLPGFSSSVVLAAGRTFRINGVQLPLNVAYAFDKYGDRITVLTGWAIRSPEEPF
jgi:hypothetical protein